MEEITEEDKKNLKKICEENNYKYIDVIGKGGMGYVCLVYKDNHIYAFKILLPKNEDEKIIPELVQEFRGPNLIKILIENTKKNNNYYYYFYVMEFSRLGNIYKFKKCLNDNLIFKDPFENNVGDNLIRFFALQLVNAIKNLNQGDLGHFDIKPDI